MRAVSRLASRSFSSLLLTQRGLALDSSGSLILWFQETLSGSRSWSHLTVTGTSRSISSTTMACGAAAHQLCTLNRVARVVGGVQRASVG